MLEILSIKNYALIDQLEIHFSSGLNILTGETGAGKSIILGALGLILGEKADTDSIRTGKDEAEVSAVILIGLQNQDSIKEWLNKRDIETEDDRLFIRRTVKRSGRGNAYINSVPMPLKELKELTSLLFDIHGQHDHQSLLKSKSQRLLLDRFGNLEEKVQTVEAIYKKNIALKKEIEELQKSEREKLREKDMLEYAVEEIQQAQLKKDEESQLQEEIQLMENSEHLHESIQEIRELLGGSGKVIDLLQKSSQELSRASNIDQKLQADTQRLEQQIYEIEDIHDTLRHYLESVIFQPERLDEMHERLQLIHKLEKKYGDTIDDILRYADQARNRLEDFEHSDEKRRELEKQFEICTASLISEAQSLSEKRTAVSRVLTEKISSNLHVLGMPDAEFAIDIKQRKNDQGNLVCSTTGTDLIQYTISPNPGEPKKPINQIASGGELSRIMLALKSSFAQADTINTLIFDEIDSGIGGAVALSVGDKLSDLGKDRQVICITHIASIAAKAERHIVVDKNIYENRTVTTIREIQEEERVREIARMLSGDTEQKSAVTHAETLIAQS
ncbi:MAG: DNA repair protein RecN [Spirochaetia bacterium]|nr:DNA repair protein RecN [Spirochaetia bacterium]MCF7946458.1 DNA repair protein RecN [Spirochaetia bacterium]